MNRIIVAIVVLLIMLRPVAADTPRERHIKELDYSWDMSSSRNGLRCEAPFFGTFEIQKTLQFYYCDTCYDSIDIQCLSQFDDNYVNQVIKEWQRNNEEYKSKEDHYWNASFDFYPYDLQELKGIEVNLAYIYKCIGHFNSIEDIYVFGTDEEEEKLRLELRLSENVFTEQFLNFIQADDDLKRLIRTSGLISRSANESFRNAWLDGRLKRPTVAFATGECGAGGMSVEIEFSEPTSRFQIIPDFDYFLCRKFNLNPWDADKCPHVRDKTDGLNVFGGRYHVKIVRDSGEVIFREISLDYDSPEKMKL